MVVLLLVLVLCVDVGVVFYFEWCCVKVSILLVVLLVDEDGDCVFMFWEYYFDWNLVV